MAASMPRRSAPKPQFVLVRVSNHLKQLFDFVAVCFGGQKLFEGLLMPWHTASRAEIPT